MGNWLTDLYVSGKEAVKDSYDKTKKAAKGALKRIGVDSNSTGYKRIAKAAHITEPIIGGVTETIEFVAKNPAETYSVVSDLAAWTIGVDKLDSKRLLNYLYDYSKETGSDVKALLDELPPETLSAALKSVNNQLSEVKNIPCSQVCMDIALSDPKNLKTDEYRTVEESTIDRILSEIKDDLSPNELKRYKEDLPLIMFKAGSKHSRMLQENDAMQAKLKEWAKKPEKDRKSSMSFALEVSSDPKNGYDAYASFHNVNIINPQIDADGNITAYVYDVYDFERASFNGQMLDLATIMAYHLQETGHIQNYKMLIPITIPASELKK